jgi:[acyl-carrier-protein] S-malonyltransferase
VHWTASIQALQAGGCGVFLECGPGKVLAGLLKRIGKDLRCVGLEEPAGIEQARSLIAGA